MRALFCVCGRKGNGTSPATAFWPWFVGQEDGFAGEPIGDQYACNVFSDNQATLDAIAADPRTEFSFPIDVSGNDMDYGDAFNVPPFTRGKIISWCARTFGSAFGQVVAANAQNRRHIAQNIMRRASGVPDADPLNGWRIHWS